jgi:hypothetical protein
MTLLSLAFASRQSKAGASFAESAEIDFVSDRTRAVGVWAGAARLADPFGRTVPQFSASAISPMP